MIPEKVLICGVCKDVADHLPLTLKIMRKIGELFEDYQILIYENNSSDNTKQLLEVAALTMKNIWFACSDQKPDVINWHDDEKPFKPETIAFARNRLMEIIENPVHDTVKYVIIMDMDFFREPDYSGIVEVFERPEHEWDAVFANGIAPDTRYWDWFAFRDQEQPFGPELIGHNEWYVAKEKIFREEDKWYPVISAFGGFAVYKKEAIKGCRYSGIVTKNLGLATMEYILENQYHPIVKKYLENIHNLKLIDLPEPKIGLRKYRNYDKEGFRIEDINDINPPIIWRMNSEVYNYPGVCEHTAFHADMLLRGYKNLYINPRLIFRY